MVYDEFFPTRLELFSRLVRDFTSSFVVNQKQRRDRGFHVFRELYNYLFKLGRRCIRPAHLPAETDHQAILGLSIPDVKALGVSDFLSRSKLNARLDPACKTKAQAEKGDKKNEGLTLDEITKKNKDEIARAARSYVIFLFKEAQGLSRFTCDTVKGLGSFDLDTMLTDPLENSYYCFKQLFSSFRLRGVVQAEEETLHMEEYVSFIDILRQVHPGIQQPKLLIADAVDFLSGQEDLKSRPHLRRLFRLSCLCLDEPRLSFSPVKFGSHRTDDSLSPMFNVIAPIQSYLGYATQGLDVLTSDDSVKRFLALEQSFGNSGLTDVYSPWDSVDHFDRIKIRETLDPTGTAGSVATGSDAPQETSSLKPFAVPKPNKRRSHLLTKEELTKSAGKLIARGSKD